MAFVDVGGKGEATIEIDELKDEEGNLEVAVGDRVQAMVVSTAGGLTLSRRLARGGATERQLEDAFRTGLPVEGKVERAVKGGYEVRIARQRAFCPLSQIDIVRTEPSVHDGRVYEFRIIEYKEGGKNLVVSRRALLEEEQRASAVEVRRSIVAGAVMTGRVTSVREFGAFVDLGGGVQGLLHVSEMGWSRVSNRDFEFKELNDPQPLERSQPTGVDPAAGEVVEAIAAARAPVATIGEPIQFSLPAAGAKSLMVFEAFSQQIFSSMPFAANQLLVSV